MPKKDFKLMNCNVEEESILHTRNVNVQTLHIEVESDVSRFRCQSILNCYSCRRDYTLHSSGLQKFGNSS